MSGEYTPLEQFLYDSGWATPGAVKTTAAKFTRGFLDVHDAALTRKAKAEALLEAAVEVSAQISPWHDGRDTQIFWRAQSMIADALSARADALENSPSIGVDK